MKTQTKFLQLVIALIAGFGFSTSSFGQSQADSLAVDDDQILATIAKYPADMRAAILDVAQYPKVLVKLEKVQARSSQSFQDLVEPLSRTEQEKLYQASRFPETVSQLVMVGKEHPSRIQPILKDFPSELQQQLFSVYNYHYDELVKMDAIYQTAQGKLATLTDEFLETTQNSFKKVLANPDVMTLLTDNINVTVSLGNSYQSDPQGITSQLDEMNQKLTEQGGKDLLAYQEEVAKDPALQSEMKNAADDYAKQNNQPYYNPAYVNNSYYNTPYPYWLGYPSWYGSPMWYPYSYYQSGYYFGNNGIVILSMPSYGYSRWFYSRGYSRYPRMYSCYNTYYYRPMRNIAYGYRDMYSRSNRTYVYHNSRGGNSYFKGYRTRDNTAPSSGYNTPARSYGRTSYSRSDSYSRSRNSVSRSYQPTLQQGVYYNQRYAPYHASTYYVNPSLRSNNSGSRGYGGTSGFTGGSGYRGGSRGSGATGFGGGRGYSGGGGHGRGK